MVTPVHSRPHRLSPTVALPLDEIEGVRSMRLQIQWQPSAPNSTRVNLRSTSSALDTVSIISVRVR